MLRSDFQSETVRLPTLLSATVLVCAFLSVDVAADSFEPTHRRVLTEALTQYRLRELGWLTSREACLAHARTLGPLNRKASAVAWCYVGLNELHAGDHASASQSFRQCLDLLSDNEPRTATPDQAATSGQATTAGGQSGRATSIDEAATDALTLADYWLGQLESSPDFRPSREQMLDPAHRPTRVEMEFIVDVQPQASSDVESESASGRASTLEYRLVDPATITEQTSGAVIDLPVAGTTTDAWLQVIWRGLLSDGVSSVDVLPAFAAAQSGVTSGEASASEILELSALQWVCSKPVTKFRSPILAANEVPLPLWALQALSLSPHSTVPLSQARGWLRGMIGDIHPFDGRLLFPQKKSQLSKSRYVRDCYLAVGQLYATRGEGDSGFWMVEPTSVDQRRAARVMSELASPIRRSPTDQMSPLHTVLWACASARSGDYESWQLLPLNDQPLWPEVISWARIVAGDLRTRPRGPLRGPEDPIEPPDVLLVGTEGTLDIQSVPDTDGEASPPADGTNLLTWLLVAAVCGTGLCVLTVVWRRSRSAR